MSAGGERGPAPAASQWGASVATMGPRGPTGSGVCATPARPPLALAGTADPERLRARSPAPPLGALHAGKRVPPSARLWGAPPAVGLPFPACSAAARRPGTASRLPASAGRLRSGAGFGRSAEGGGQRRSGGLAPGPASLHSPPPAGAGLRRGGAAAAGERHQRVRHCRGSYGGTR